MTISRFQRAARCATTIIVITATVGFAGCDPKATPVASAPAGEAAGLPPDRPAMITGADTKSMSTTEKPVTAAGVSIKVKVSLDPAVAKKAAPDDVVYIFARAAHGPRMPLAIVRKQVKDLPTTVVLDDSSGMMSDMKLSSVPEVIVIARVSKSGNPSAQAGDLEGMSVAIKPNAQTMEISITNVLPGK